MKYLTRSFCFGKEYWGKGIATKTHAEFLAYVKIRPLYAHVAKHNIGSFRMLQKCGFKVSGEDKFFDISGKYLLITNVILDSLPYILKIGTLMNAENTDYFLLSAKVSVFQSLKIVLYGREILEKNNKMPVRKIST